MTRVLLTISYDGSKFSGFQRQNNARNIQGEIEKVLTNMYNSPIAIKGAGRTDAKVHAKGQCAHVDIPFKIKNFKKELNNNLIDIKIKKIKYVNDEFHARFSVKKKIYVYKLLVKKKYKSDYFGVYHYDLDYKKMREASKLFVGFHNFKNFVAGHRDNYEAIIDDIYIFRIKNRFYFIFIGKSFYRYMVRNIVGALIDVGRGSAEVSTIEEMLQTENFDKRLATAKAEGLFLCKIKY